MPKASGSDGKLIFVREKHSLRFINEQGMWVRSFADAAKFCSTWEAFDFCLKKSVYEAEVVLRIGEPMYDVTIAVL